MRAEDQAEEFLAALSAHAHAFGVQLRAGKASLLLSYYERVVRWNSALNLVGHCSPAEFATRHVLESLLLLPHLTKGARVADVGSGAGLSIVPCLIVRPDISAILIESSKRKSIFLRETVKTLANNKRSIKVIAERFEDVPSPEADFITCRALDQFARQVKPLLDWAPEGSTLLLFGGQTLRKALEVEPVSLEEQRVPNSHGRFLFIVRTRASAKRAREQPSHPPVAAV